MKNAFPRTEGPDSLYQRMLGADYDCLPPVLRRFHAETEEGGAQGTLCITRGSGRIRNLLAALMRLPQAGKEIPIHLHVRMEGDQEIWTRRFDTLPMVTRQWQEKGLLIEAAGPLRFGFRLTADATGMGFHFDHCRFFRLRLPLALSPRVKATVRGQEASWWIEVQVEVPLFGMIVRYEGEVTPQYRRHCPTPNTEYQTPTTPEVTPQC